MSQREMPFTTTELAKRAGVSDAYIRRLLIDGKLTGQKLGPWWVISVDVAQKWLEDRQRKTE